MAGAAPPGLQSPAAFPFTPAAFPNDAPPVTPQPYYIGQGTASTTGTAVTLAVQNPTAPGDAIVVSASSSNGGPGGLSCTDTQGNTYSLVNSFTSNKSGAQWVAQNTAPLGTSDTITATFAGSTANTRIGIAVGCPAAATPGPGATPPFLTYDMSSAAGSGGGVVSVNTAPAGRATRYPQLVIAAAYNGGLAGPPQWRQGFITLRTAVQPAGDYVVVAYQFVPRFNAGAVVVTTFQGAANVTLMYVTLIPETRFARRAADMPPGFMPPGAWQFLPLPRGGPVTGTLYPSTAVTSAGSIADQVAKPLPVTAAASGALTRQAAKSYAGTTAASGSLTRTASRALAAAVTAAGSLTRSAARVLTAAAAAAAALSRVLSRSFPASAATAGSLGRGLSRALAASAGTAGALTRTLARAFPGTAGTAGKLARGIARAFAAACATAGSIISFSSHSNAGTVTAADSLTQSVAAADWLVMAVTAADSQLMTVAAQDSEP
jgi:hypothetical protein